MLLVVAHCWCLHIVTWLPWTMNRLLWSQTGHSGFIAAGQHQKLCYILLQFRNSSLHGIALYCFVYHVYCGILYEYVLHCTVFHDYIALHRITSHCFVFISLQFMPLIVWQGFSWHSWNKPKVGFIAAGQHRTTSAILLHCRYSSLHCIMYCGI